MKIKGLISSVSIAVILSICAAGCESRLLPRIIDMPPVTSKKIVVEKDVMVEMRDGARLATDIYRPAAKGKYPVVMVRIPYNKNELLPMLGEQFAKRGYVAVMQDCRGTFNSDGRFFFPLFREANDGIDTIEWLDKQPWYNGSFGMWGGSYFGYTQWAVAPDNEQMKCWYPLITTPSMSKAFLIGGAMQYEFTTTWTNSVGKQNQGISEQNVKPDPEGGWYNLPLEPPIKIDFTKLAFTMEDPDALNKMLGLNLPFPKTGPIPRDLSQKAVDVLLPLFSYPSLTRNQPALMFEEDNYKKISSPAMGCAGWYDIFLQPQIDDFVKLWSEAEGGAREHSKLFIGPWGHGVPSHMAAGGKRKFDNDKEMYRYFVQTDWFEKWLKGRDNGADEGAPLRIYVMGANKWRDEYEWPLARMEATKFYLHGGGAANTMNGDGTLSLEAPTGDEPPDSFIFDPSDPVPTSGGALLSGELSGMKLQNHVEERDDVLVYTYEVTEDTEITGPISAVIYASSTAFDTDWTVKLVDVRPDGSVVNLQDGIVRARYRDGMDMAPNMIIPRKVYEYHISLWSTSYLYKAGHKIRIEVSSSNFPRFERNCGLAGSGKPGEFITARQVVYHDAEHPSHILLPIIPAK